MGGVRVTVERVYFFSGSGYVRFDVALNGVLPVYPLDIASQWPGLFGADIGAAVVWGDKVYFFRGGEYCRYDVAANVTDPGYPKPIGPNWPNVAGSGFENGIDAAVNWGNGKAYWFKRDLYIRKTAATESMDSGYPKPITGNWPGVAGTGFEHGIDDAINYGNDKVYWFKGDQYLRMDGATKSADPGYPKPIAGNWPGVYGSGIGAAVEWPVTTPTPPPPPSRFVRRSVWGLNAQGVWDPATLAYAQAVQLMQSRPISDPTSWAYQAAMHDSYSTAPAGAPWRQCQHASWYFLPWHRMYVYYFERIVRAAVASAGGPADFALPYWNYDAGGTSSSLPPPFREPTLPDGSANPLSLAAPQRAAGVAGGAGLTRTSSRLAMALTTFIGDSSVGFGGPRKTKSAAFDGVFGGLESLPHNTVHVQIGGTSPRPPHCGEALMTQPACAALDPIFWLHHCNIDRLWNHWLAQGGGRANPNESAWLDESWTFADETGALVGVTVAQVLSGATQLNYEYDDLPGV